MVKKITSLNIDSDVVANAKRYGFNMSELAEDAIKKRCGIKEVEIDTNAGECFYCERKMEQATADNPNVGLTWLWPDGKWICPKCLKLKVNRVIFGKNA